MIIYALSTTQILVTIAGILAAIYLVLFIVVKVLERNRGITDVQDIIDSLERCSLDNPELCEKCKYRHRGTPTRTCREALLYDSENLIKDQQELIAKFGKKTMKE